MLFHLLVVFWTSRTWCQHSTTMLSRRRWYSSDIQYNLIVFVLCLIVFVLCLIVFVWCLTDVGEYGKETTSNTCWDQWRCQRCTGRCRLCHVVRRNSQGRLPTRDSPDNAQGLSPFDSILPSFPYMNSDI